MNIVIKKKEDIQEVKFCGIYCILNTENQLRYIGSSIDIGARIKMHRSRLNNNKHDNSKLQMDWTEYGSESFIFIILEQCSKEDLIEREQYYINKYSKDSLYNLMHASIEHCTHEKPERFTYLLYRYQDEKIAELAKQANMGKNEFIRQLLDDVLYKIEIK